MLSIFSYFIKDSHYSMTSCTRGGVFGGRPVYENIDVDDGTALFYSSFMGGYQFGYQNTLVDILYVSIRNELDIINMIQC